MGICIHKGIYVSSYQGDINFHEVSDSYELWIADYNTTVSVIKELNHLKNPNFLTAGEILKVPAHSSTSSTTYTVTKEDTLYSITKNIYPSIQ